MTRRLSVLRVVHPFPSSVNAALVAAIALVAGAPVERAAVLAVAMLAVHFSIGALNDVVDEAADRVVKPAKPLVAGALSRRAALVVAAVAAGTALVMTASVEGVVFAMAVATLGAGVAYDLVLKRTAWGWTAFAVAFALLPLYAWYGATGALPPRYEVVVPVGAAAGLGLQLANNLVDADLDRASHVNTLAARLGSRRAALLMVVTLAIVHGLAWWTLADAASIAATGLAAAATTLAAAGVLFTLGRSRVLREAGWKAQAVSIACLATAWLTAAVSA